MTTINRQSAESVNELLNLLLPEGTPSGQRNAVTCDDGLLVVGAGAGTGKTWVLSTRFARLLFSDPECLPRNILTLTFTEAAAREMQERIRRRATDLAAQRGSEQETQAVREGFDEAWISTIHSFSARLIRESGLSLDIDPRSSVVTAPQEEAFWNSAARALETPDLASLNASGDRALAALGERVQEDPLLTAALEKWSPAALADLAKKVIELHDSLGHSWTLLAGWADEAEKEDDPAVKAMSRALKELLRPGWDEAWTVWRDIFNVFQQEIRDAYQDALKKTDAKREDPAIPLCRLMEDWLDLMNKDANSGGTAWVKNPEENSAESFAESFEQRRCFFADACARLKGGTSKLFKAIGAELGQTVTAWRDKRLKWQALSEVSPDLPLSLEERRLRALLMRFSAFAWGTWDERKRQRGLLSFADMIRFAARSLQTNAPAKGFRHILVDEFQDTDPLQDALIQELRDREGARLFLVGDPKQAIYRFRHADLTLFAGYALQSRASGGNIALDVSFRTRDALLRPVNSLFARIWKNGLGAGEQMSRLKFDPLFPPENTPPERDLTTVVPFTLLLSVKKGRPSKEARTRLARDLVRTFRQWVEEERTVWDKKEGSARPVRWKDFAVLTPTRGEYEILETAFEEAGVPAAFEKSMSWFSRGEVTDLVNTLRAVAFPDDETALAGWLTSPFSCVSLFRATECLNEFTLLHEKEKREKPGNTGKNLSLASFIAERLPEANRRLEQLRCLGNLKGPSALLSFLLEDRTWLACFPPALRQRVVGNVRRAAALARQYENGVMPGMVGCADWLDAALRGDRAVEEPEWVDEDADAVRVTTIHASKGLEYPVVAVMKMERGAVPNSRETLLPSKTMGVTLSALPDMMQKGLTEDAGPGNAPRSLKWEQALHVQGGLEESARLFYVAATRAQDALILCGLISEDVKGKRNVKEDSWLEWTLDWLAEEQNCDRFDVGAPVLYAESEKPENTAPAVSRPPDTPNTPPLPLSLPDRENLTLENLSATSYALFEWCPLAWRRRHRQGMDLRWEMPDAEGDAPGGSLLGTLAHRLLETWDMREETLESLMSDANTVLHLPVDLRAVWREEKNREALRNWLLALARSDEGRAVTEAEKDGTLKRESAFCVLLDDYKPRSPRTLRLIGAFDALRRNPDGWWNVRDYKITLSDNAPKELYSAQLDFYALVVKLLAEKQGIPFAGVDVGLVFLREGGRLDDARSFPGSGDWNAPQKRVLDAARAAAQGPWQPKREHCSRCPWAKDCSGRLN